MSHFSCKKKKISHENQETSFLKIKKVRTRLKLLLYVKERLPEKDLQNCEQRTIQQRENKNKNTKIY
jgi:hypothetical protein